MVTTQMMLMLFTSFFCMFKINQNVRSYNKILPNAATASDLSKCQQEEQTDRYTVVGGEAGGGRKDHSFH